MEQLGAGSGAERVETFSDSAFEFIGTHGSGDYASPSTLPPSCRH
jgi:hypothetical protein